MKQYRSNIIVLTYLNGFHHRYLGLMRSYTQPPEQDFDSESTNLRQADQVEPGVMGWAGLTQSKLPKCFVNGMSFGMKAPTAGPPKRSEPLRKV